MDCKKCGKPKIIKAKGMCGTCYKEAWRAANPDKRRAERVRHYAKHRARLLAYSAASAAANPGRAAARARQQRARIKQLRAAGDPAALLSGRRGSAKSRGIEFTLTVATIPRLPKICPVFCVPFGGRVGPPSLDRVDSSRGYVPGNVQWISELANRIKSDATSAEVAAVAAFLLKHELLS